MRILVTGANGFLGHRVVMELIERNHEVVIIVRNIQRLCFNLSAVKLVEGNFTNYETLRTAASNCEAIIHIAAVTSTNLLNYSDYSKVNVEGSAQLIKVADELNINTLIYVSSANTIGYGTEQKPADECSKIKFPFTKSFYALSKIKAEHLFEEASQRPFRHVVIVHPGFMLGAVDTKPSSGKLVLMGYKRRLLFIPKGGKNFVPVQDVATAVCNTLTMGRNGEHYLTTGVNLSFREYYSIQAQEGNYHQLIIEIPDFFIKIAGKFGDFLQFLNCRTDICSRNLNQLLIREYYTNEKAKKELLMSETKLDIAVKEAIVWFKDKKML